MIIEATYSFRRKNIINFLQKWKQKHNRQQHQFVYSFSKDSNGNIQSLTITFDSHFLCINCIQHTFFYVVPKNYSFLCLESLRTILHYYRNQLRAEKKENLRMVYKDSKIKLRPNNDVLVIQNSYCKKGYPRISSPIDLLNSSFYPKETRFAIDKILQDL